MHSYLGNQESLIWWKLWLCRRKRELLSLQFNYQS